MRLMYKMCVIGKTFLQSRFENEMRIKWHRQYSYYTIQYRSNQRTLLVRAYHLKFAPYVAIKLKED